MSRVKEIEQAIGPYCEKIIQSVTGYRELMVDIIRRPQNHKEDLLVYSSRLALVAALIFEGESFVNENSMHKFIANVALVGSMVASAVIERRYKR